VPHFRGSTAMGKIKAKIERKWAHGRYLLKAACRAPSSRHAVLLSTEMIVRSEKRRHTRDIQIKSRPRGPGAQASGDLKILGGSTYVRALQES
jgi:hypothetical protein